MVNRWGTCLLASRSSVGSPWFEVTFLGLFTCLLSLSTFFVSLVRVSSICLSDWASLWGKLVGGTPVMMFSSSDTSSMMRDSVIEEVLVSISVMNIEWDYSYYQPWSDNEWLVDEIIAM